MIHMQKGVQNCCPRIGREGQGRLLIGLTAKKFLASREGAAEGGFKGGIPPRPSGLVLYRAKRGSQFRSKWVRAFSNKGHQIGLRDFLWGEAEVCSPRRTVRLSRGMGVQQ